MKHWKRWLPNKNEQPAFFYLLLHTLVPMGIVTFGLCILRSAPLTCLAYHAWCLAIASINGGFKRMGRLPSVGECCIAVGVATVASVLVVMLWRMTGDMIADPDLCRLQIEHYRLPVDKWWLFAIYFVTVNPLLEEAYWRGVVHVRAKKLGIKSKLGLALPFALWHVIPIWLVCGSSAAMLGLLAVYGFGLLITRMVEQSQSLVRAVLWHSLVADGAIIALLFACL